MRRVLIVGDAVLDVVVRPLAALVANSDTPCDVLVTRGGAAANLAVALRAVIDDNFEVEFVGVVGNDDTARLIRADLDSAGVLARLSEVSGTTGVVVAIVGNEGERSMMTARGVTSELREEHVTPWLDDDLAHLHVSGYSILDPHTRELAARLLETANQLGASTSVDVCSVGPLRDVGVVVFTQYARGATTLFANEEEALTLAGADNVDEAVERLCATWSEVVVTRGALGAVAAWGGRHYEVSAVDSGAAVVDTTGAGDCATGTYLGRRLAGDDVVHALSAAMIAAADVVRGLGSRGASRH